MILRINRSRALAESIALAIAVGTATFSACPAAAQPVDRWSRHIDEASARFGVPDGWIRRVMRAESGGRTTLAGRPITSRAGAMGLMQLMPGTWREMRAVHSLGTNPHDPRDNILAGTAYLRAMYNRFGFPGMFAAYNAGPARYANHLVTGRRLPAETIAYVATVSATGRKRSVTFWQKPQKASVFTMFAENPRPRSKHAPPLAASKELFEQLGAIAAASEDVEPAVR